MPHNIKVSPFEKIISILSYATMGIIGLVFVILAYFLKKNIKYFLMYNIAQSMLISIILAAISILISIFIKILYLIPFLVFLSTKLYLFFTNKIIAVPFFNISFTFIQFLVFLLILYISIGIIYGRIFYIPFLTKIMKRAMNSYK